MVVRDRVREEIAKVARQAIDQIGAQLLPTLLGNLVHMSNDALGSLYDALVSGTWGEFRNSWKSDIDDPEIQRRLIKRIRLISGLDTDEKRAQEMDRCAESCVYFIEHWGWSVDPRLEDLIKIPIELWDRQREVVEWIMRRFEGKTSGLVKKSRDVGLSVIVTLIGAWFWLFKPRTQVFYSSKKEGQVHTLGDPDSLLEKVRLILENLPGWMRPKGFKFAKHFKELLISNPENGAKIKGEAGDQMGRGGRSTIYFADEFSVVPRAQACHSAIKGNTNCAIYFGTSQGPATYFHELEDTFAEADPDRVLYFPWYHDPRKVDDPADVGNPKATSVWERETRHELGDMLFAQEFGCDDSMAMENAVIEMQWVNAAKNVDLPADGPAVAGVDVGGEGDDPTVIAVRKGPRVLTPLQEWKSYLPKTAAVVVHRAAAEKGVVRLVFDRAGIGIEFEDPIREAAGGIYDIYGVHGQNPPPKGMVWGRMGRPAAEQFANMTTLHWFSLRERFRKTFEYWKDPESCPYPVDELICIPPVERVTPDGRKVLEEDYELMRQLTSRKHMPGGKLQLESKKKMRSSPDRADALALIEDPTWTIERELDAEPLQLPAPKSDLPAKGYTF